MLGGARGQDTPFGRFLQDGEAIYVALLSHRHGIEPAVAELATDLRERVHEAERIRGELIHHRIDRMKELRW